MLLKCFAIATHDPEITRAMAIARAFGKGESTTGPEACFGVPQIVRERIPVKPTAIRNGSAARPKNCREINGRNSPCRLIRK